MVPSGMNGGLPKWKSDGYAVTDEPTTPRTERHFTPRFNGALVRDIDDVKTIIKNGGEQIIDARAAGRIGKGAREVEFGSRPTSPLAQS